MKRRLSIILAIAMVLSLCACGGSQSAPPAGDSNKTQEQADSAEEKQEAAEPAAESAEPAAEAEAPAAEAEGTAADTAMEIDMNERRLTRPQVFEPAHVDALSQAGHRRRTDERANHLTLSGAPAGI